MAVTGIAGPGTDGVNPVGTVYDSLAVPRGDSTPAPSPLGAHRTRGYVKRMAGNHAFDMLPPISHGASRIAFPVFPRGQACFQEKPVDSPRGDII